MLKELGIRGQAQTLNRTPQLFWFSPVSLQVVSQQCNKVTSKINPFHTSPSVDKSLCILKGKKKHKQTTTKTVSGVLTVRQCLASAHNTEPSLNRFIYQTLKFLQTGLANTVLPPKDRNSSLQLWSDLPFSGSTDYRSPSPKSLTGKYSIP